METEADRDQIKELLGRIQVSGSYDSAVYATQLNQLLSAQSGGIEQQIASLPLSKQQEIRAEVAELVSRYDLPTQHALTIVLRKYTARPD